MVLEDFPDDLENFFNVKGGTIDLLLKGTAKDSKDIIINEVMWAVDTSKSGQPGEFNQQWIEVYNKTSIPVLDDDITFMFIDDTFPPPATKAGTSDRLSNIAGRQNIWDVKGSSGAATRDDDGYCNYWCGSSIRFHVSFQAGRPWLEFWKLDSI